MLLSAVRIAFIPGSLLLAGISDTMMYNSLSLTNSASYSPPTTFKGHATFNNIGKLAIVAGAAGLLVHHANGGNFTHPFYHFQDPTGHPFGKTYPIANTFASGEPPLPRPTRTRSGRSSAGTSSNSAPVRSYNLRSHSRAMNRNRTPPDEDPPDSPSAPNSSGGPGPSSSSSSPTGPHAPVKGSGAPPPPPPPSSGGTGVDDKNNKPLSAVRSFLDPILLIFVLVLLYSKFTRKEAPPQPTVKPMHEAAAHDPPRLPRLQGSQHSTLVCLTSVAETVNACAPKYSYAASLTKFALVVIAGSCWACVNSYLPHIVVCLLPVGFYFSGLFNELDKAAAPLDQIVHEVDNEEEHQNILPTWSTDSSFEVGRVNEFLVPRHEDIKASLFAQWGDMEGGLLEGADYLHDKAFIEESVMTDWDDPSDGGSFFKDEVQTSFDLPLIEQGLATPSTSASPLSPCRDVVDLDAASFFSGSTPRVNKFNSRISGGTRSRSSSISESSVSVPLFVSETPTRPSPCASMEVSAATESRAQCASIQAPQSVDVASPIDGDDAATPVDEVEIVDGVTPESSPEPSETTQAFEPRPGHRRRRKHRRRSKKTANAAEGSSATGAADEVSST